MKKHRKRKTKRAAYRGVRRNLLKRYSRHKRSRRNPQQHRVSGTATSIIRDGGKVTVSYHNTAVVKFDDKKIELNTGGWKTVTTKTRMNQASNQFSLGYSVGQKSGNWSVHYKGKEIPFVGTTLTLRR